MEPGKQFEQMSLIPEGHPALRQRTQAEMSPEQWHSQPGIMYHGNFSLAFPDQPYSHGEEGIHTGTREAAMDRLDDMERFSHRSTTRRNRMVRPPAPDNEGYIHRVLVDPAKTLQNTPETPEPDEGYGWKLNGHYGRYYKNETEHAGSVSLVADRRVYKTHGEVVGDALAKGQPVHPRTKAYYNMGVIDQPERYRIIDSDEIGSAPFHHRLSPGGRGDIVEARDNVRSGLSALQPSLYPWSVRHWHREPGTAMGGRIVTTPAVTKADAEQVADKASARSYTGAEIRKTRPAYPGHPSKDDRD